MNRCQHGIYLPQGESKAWGCQDCNPAMNSHPLIKTGGKLNTGCVAELKTMNVASYMQRENEGLRIASGFQAMQAAER